MYNTNLCPVTFLQLLRNSPYWTNNTNEADYFYVDVSRHD